MRWPLPFSFHTTWVEATICLQINWNYEDESGDIVHWGWQAVFESNPTQSKRSVHWCWRVVFESNQGWTIDVDRRHHFTGRHLSLTYRRKPYTPHQCLHDHHHLCHDDIFNQDGDYVPTKPLGTWWQTTAVKRRLKKTWWQLCGTKLDYLSLTAVMIRQRHSGF